RRSSRLPSTARTRFWPPSRRERSNVSVNAKIEGRTDGPAGAEWITLQSTGNAEQEFLAALIENITGAAPTGAIKSREFDLKVSATIADTMTKTVSVDVTRNSLLIN